jgi:hypothetical protein
MKSDKIIGTDSVHAVDCDGTLILWDGCNWEWNWKLIDKMIQARIRGQTVIVWTAGGMEWLKKVQHLAERDSVDVHIDFYMNKIKWYHDDEDANSWMKHLLP